MEGGGGFLERLVPGACLLIPSVAQLQLSQTPRGNFEGTGWRKEGVGIPTRGLVVTIPQRKWMMKDL